MDEERKRRPSPDALLAQLQREARGQLKIFLGAAPGVGKTYTMLETAHVRKREGGDVVVGVVETHGRVETQALVDGLEVLPRRSIEYRGRSYLEMDLEAILARRPQIVLVDELAHTNIPGSRHIKRYQDVEEILAAGINVYSTLNVQHLESLNDVIERIAGIKVRETLPDSVLHGADEIELVDLSPEDLLKRLAEGKVYVPEQAQRAVHNFFSRGTLTALRELSLRQAAERVDAQMLDYMKVHAVAGPWPTRDRVLVSIGHDASAIRLVRSAKRVADRRSAPWVAIYVETHRHHGLSEEAKDLAAQALRLAEQMGGEACILQGDDVTGEILDYAHAHNITQIVVGRRRKKGPRWLVGASTTEDLLARAGGIDVLVLGSEVDPRSPKVWDRSVTLTAFPWQGYGLSLLGIAAVSGLCWLVKDWLPVETISVAYLLVVLVIAIRLGLRPAILASVTGFLVINFLFSEPRFSFGVHNLRNTIALFFFFGAAVITSNLAGRVRTQMEATRLSSRRTANLYEFSRRVSGAATQDDVLWAVVHHVAATIRGRSLLLLPRHDRLEIRAGYPPEDRLDDRDQAAAEWAWTRGVPTGRGSTTLPTASWLFLPMQTAGGPVGVLGVQIEGGETALPPETSRLVQALVDQAALAIERTNLVADVETAKVATETERLRTALLSSLSAELRTPIVSILEAAARLRNRREPGPEGSERQQLALLIQDEAEQLNRFVQNLLDMTRLGAGALKPRADWASLTTIIEAALARAKRLLRDRPVRIDIDPEIPPMRVDRTLIEQVFFNLIDNACKHAPATSPITIWARLRGPKVLIEVSDEGPGIAPHEREKVFDIFYRIERAGASPATGLGLAICRGIVQAHGGTIRVDSGLNDVGTSICIQLPIGVEPVRGEEPRAA